MAAELVFHYEAVPELFPEGLHLFDALNRLRIVLCGEIAVVVDAHRHLILAGDIGPGLV